MSKSFTELVIEGPFLLVKGFLMGFKYSCNESMEYFFHRKAGIKRETLKDLLQEYFELESYTHICIEDNIIKEFSQALEKSSDIIKLGIKSKKKIKTAAFTFNFDVFSKEVGNEIKSIINEIPTTVGLKHFKDEEYEDDKAKGIEMYAPTHNYSYSGKGALEGEFSDLVKIYRKMKNVNGFNVNDISLNFA